MAFLNSYYSEIERLCRSHNVKSLYVFGSVLSDQFTKDSDVDLIVDFENIDVEDYADNYYDLKFALQSILKRPIDLLEERALKNPYFIEAVKTKRQLVYGH